MNIISSAGYPASTLSNFTANVFIIDGVRCNSMEGFLQSLKFKSPEMQSEVCKLVGRGAKFRGKKKKWWKTQTLWWRGQEINRHSNEYQLLLNRAYNAMFIMSPKFKKALLETRDNRLTHSIGKGQARQTVLTESEFCKRLMHLRDVGLLPMT